MKRTVAAAAVAVAGIGLFAPPAAADPGFVTPPGGNIGCEVYDF